LEHSYYLPKASLVKRCLGWLIHAFTASGACIGLLSLLAIYENKLIISLWLMAAAIVIDAVDGMFARMVRIKEVIPKIDGALLDNIVDFVNYSIVPAFFLLVSDLLPDYWRVVITMFIVFASAYQFTQVDAKTKDHFFKGFPSYWNIAVFYLFFWQMQPWVNLAILVVLSILIFVPIKYVYPSRLDNLSSSKWVRTLMALCTIVWGVATTGLLVIYPKSNPYLVTISLGYIILYVMLSLYRTLAPLTPLSHLKNDYRL
jgi:phosphatidylcholine synthase